jgi:hypothetical protein
LGTFRTAAGIPAQQSDTRGAASPDREIEFSLDIVHHQRADFDNRYQHAHRNVARRSGSDRRNTSAVGAAAHTAAAHSATTADGGASPTSE